MKRRHVIQADEAEVPVYIKERSFIARIAAWKLDAQQVALVIGNTIHLNNTTAEEFLSNKRWVQHEVCHIKQFRRYGFFNFILIYLFESLRKGYYNNRFEKEAREAEQSA